MHRRSFLKFLLSAAAAEAIAAEIDLERLLWVPKTIITVPEMPNADRLIAAAWEDHVKGSLTDSPFSHFWLLEQLKFDPRQSVLVTDGE